MNSYYILIISHRNQFMSIEVRYESETEVDVLMEVDSDNELEVEPPQKRRSITKKQWITPRLCAALDKAKVKRKRLKL